MQAKRDPRAGRSVGRIRQNFRGKFTSLCINPAQGGCTHG